MLVNEMSFKEIPLQEVEGAVLIVKTEWKGEYTIHSAQYWDFDEKGTLCMYDDDDKEYMNWIKEDTVVKVVLIENI